MKDFLKISTIYIVMWAMMYVFENYFEAGEFNTLVYFILQSIVLIIMFKKFELNSTDIIIFCSLLAFLLILSAIDSNIIFSEYTEIINNIKAVVPHEIIGIINFIAKPFFAIFLVLGNTQFKDYSIYIVPCYIALVAYISVNNVKN